MLYYKRHIGDYIRDTSHLSLLEHGAYARLLDVYYSRESPLPESDVVRLVGARGKDETAAVHTVLQEFWTLTPDGWIQNRSDHEIEKARNKAEANRENGKLGGNPKKKGGYNEPGFVYAIQRVEGGRIKVGITKYLPQRMSALRSKFGKLRQVCLVEVTDMGASESAVHEHFRSRLDGEWVDAQAEELRESMQAILLPYRLPITTQHGSGITSQSPALSNNPITPTIQLSNLNPPTPLEGGPAGATAPSRIRSREARNQSSAKWKQAMGAVDRVKGTDLTWAYVTEQLADPIADGAIQAIGGHKRIADRESWSVSDLERRFREAYEKIFDAQSGKGREVS